MRKRNISFVIVGLVAVLLLTALPMVAGKSQVQAKDINEWLMTLSKEQREKFDRVIKKHLDRYRASKEKSADEPSGFFEGINQDIKQVVTPDQFAAFQALFKKKPIAEDQTRWVAKRCYPCVIARGYLSSALTDLNNAQSLFNEDYCVDPPWHPPMHPVADAIHWAIIFAQMAKDNSPTSYYDCDCNKATKALDYVKTAINFVDIAVSQTSKYNCSPTPWVNYLNYAKAHLLDAQTEIQECKDISCN
ncbi:MAG: hypothetical protein GTO45_32955 [Candidatus Aminicenantes bacterium]|nr:hypothetical protein [Candidatus Aminicenantes bacterium]NIM83550.1 hypothetical protein [Candidatus Aminicenantes bacterium]NIN22950.1 hypothetical protein [Candidatus Aminicenantes bacterium]NIN46687.1 hypothetical protein [Candidatus Aminicenantes bacterium]NIN89593.1 hypothetical protein [Candidatus Aminicenantes bacterium]